MLPSLPANGAGSIPPPPPTTASSGAPPDHNSPRPPLRCPRCDSPNTKFCYYNNYSLSQPRHFCKSCRRYWTHGGALRNVPIGGGSRKSKKPRSSSRNGLTLDGALKLFQGGGIPSSPAPVVDFQLGSLSNTPFPLPRLYHPNPNNISPFGDLNLTPLAGSSFSNFLGLNFNYSSNNNNNNNNSSSSHDEEGGGSLFASSIESLSSLNLELHWKLHQQRMAELYGGGAGCGGDDLANPCEAVTTTSQMEEKPQPIFFQNLEVTTTNNAANPNAPTPVQEVGMHQWFFHSSYGGAAGSGGVENDANESRMRNAGGCVLDEDGVIEFQPYADCLAMKKV